MIDPDPAQRALVVVADLAARKRKRAARQPA